MLFVPDSHHPFVNRRAWRLMLQAMGWWRPDIIVIGGDFGDLISVSGHERTSGGILPSLEYELVSMRFALDQLEGLNPERKVYIEGNHETRLSRYIMKNAEALWGHVSVQEALSLDERGWEWSPYGMTFELGKLHITHDIGAAGMNAHRQAALAHMGSTIINHTHRMAYEVRGTYGGPPYLAAMFGWLGDSKSAATYIHDAKARSEWALGFGTGLLLEDGICHVQPVPIVNDACVVGGKLFKLDEY